MQITVITLLIQEDILKKLAIVFFCALLATTAFAHDKGDMDFSFRPLMAIPTGDFGDAYSTGFGANATFSYYVNYSFALTGSLGYINWSLDDDYGDGHFRTVPIMAGFRYYFSNEYVRPYISGELGLNMWKATMETAFGDIETDGSDLGAGFGGGLTYTIGPELMLDFGAKYDMIFTEDESTNSLMLLAGVSFWFH